MSYYYDIMLKYIIIGRYSIFVDMKVQARHPSSKDLSLLNLRRTIKIQ